LNPQQIALAPQSGCSGKNENVDPLDHEMLDILYSAVTYDSSTPALLGSTALDDVGESLSAIGAASKANCHIAKSRLTKRAITLAAALLVPDDPGVGDIAGVLSEARDHALCGKGNERHRGDGDNFREEHWYEVCSLSSADFLYGQAAKKLLEHQRLPPDQARAEVLGAVNYLGFAALLNSLRVA